jgi:hypothetical protein
MGMLDIQKSLSFLILLLMLPVNLRITWADSESGSHLVIRTHRPGIFKTSICFRSDFPMLLRRSATPESPNVSQTDSTTP